MALAPLCIRVNETIDDFEVPTCRIHAEFEKQISLFKGHWNQANDNLKEIDDCIAAMKKEIKAEVAHVAGLHDTIAEERTRKVKAQAKEEPDSAKVAEIQGRIGDLEGSVRESMEAIAERWKNIEGCRKLRVKWLAARDARKRIYYHLKEVDRSGRRDGLPIPCRAPTTDDTECAHAKQYIDGEWVRCEDHYDEELAQKKK